MNYLKGSYTLADATGIEVKTYDKAYGIILDTWTNRDSAEWLVVVGIFEDKEATKEIVGRAGVTSIDSTGKTTDEVEQEALTQMIYQAFPGMEVMHE